MKKILLLLISFGVFAFSNAQEINNEVSLKPGQALSFVPQYMIIGGMRMDYDRQIAPKGWLTLAPAFYYTDNTYMWDPDNTSYTGVGAFVNYRYFPSGKGIYALLGLNYRFLDTEYTKYNDELLHKAQFNTFGFDMSIGYQFLLVDQFFLDLYFGWGFRYSLDNSDEDPSYWSDAFLDLAYSGFLPVAGIRLGFEF